jgi:hypothetical protein
MRTDAFIGLIIICAISAPAIAYFILRRRTALSQFVIGGWLMLYASAFIAQPVFLLRKHWEGAWVLSNPSLPIVLLAQADNAWWEELAKLLALIVVMWLARDSIKPFFKELSSAIGLGLWAGLAYGAGEAVVLGILFIAPNLGPIFGMRTFTPFTLGWEFVYERFWAVQMHAIMGALIGAGVWSWFNGKRSGFVIWFIAAMVYHDFVDGQIILASFSPSVASVLSGLGAFLLPIDVALGYALVALAYRLLDRARTARQIAAGTQSTN